MSSNDQDKAAIPQASATACCSSPAAMCYWCMVSLVAWGFLSLIGIYWHPLHANSAAIILFAAAIGCFANWFRNRTFHCRITAWLFLAGGVVFLLKTLGMIKTEPRYVWLFVGLGTLVAFILEWRYAQSCKLTPMKITEKAAPTVAIVAALSTLACCVPLGFLGAVGLAGLSLWAREYRGWLLIASIVFLLIGAVQIYIRKSCVKRSKTTLVIFWTAVVVLVLVTLFPQVLANLLAG